MKEKWKDVVGFEGLYRVSNLGRVLSLGREVTNRNRWGMLRTYRTQSGFLKPCQFKSGHLMVKLYPKRIGDKKVTAGVHVLVLNAFVGLCPKGMECRHFPDQDPTNNRLDNLQWGTRQQNSDDKYLNGTVSRGNNSGMAKLTEEDIPKIRKLLAKGIKPKNIAWMFDVSPTPIYGIKRGIHWAYVK